MREFLKGLELEKETIDSIMAEHGKHLTSLKEQVESYKKENDNYKSQIKDLNSEIETNKKSLESMQEVTKENDELKSQLQLKDNQLTINDSNVKKEFRKFVTSEVSSKVDEKTDFATALESYKKDNPQYFGETVVKKVQTAPTLNGGSTQPASTSDIMNNILRGAKNNNE